MSDIEREAFEAAYLELEEIAIFERDEHGDYKHEFERDAWALWQRAWQAARQAPASCNNGQDCEHCEPEHGCKAPASGEAESGIGHEFSGIATECLKCGEINWHAGKECPAATHPPAKVPEGLIDAVQNLGPFEKDFGANFNDEFGVYHCNYCNARYEQDLCEKPELDHAEDCPVVKLRQLLTTPTPATTPETELPKGWKLVPIEPTESMMRDAADNLCGEFGVEYVRPKEQFARAVYRELVGLAPTPPQEQ